MNNELLKKLKNLKPNEEAEINGIKYKRVGDGWCFADMTTGAIGFIPDASPDVESRKTVEQRTIKKGL